MMLVTSPLVKVSHSKTNFNLKMIKTMKMMITIVINQAILVKKKSKIWENNQLLIPVCKENNGLKHKDYQKEVTNSWI